MFGFSEYNYIQVLSALSSLLMLSTTAVAHHFHEMSAKTKIPKITYMVSCNFDYTYIWDKMSSTYIVTFSLISSKFTSLSLVAWIFNVSDTRVEQSRRDGNPCGVPQRNFFGCPYCFSRPHQLLLYKVSTNLLD